MLLYPPTLCLYPHSWQEGEKQFHWLASFQISYNKSRSSSLLLVSIKFLDHTLKWLFIHHLSPQKLFPVLTLSLWLCFPFIREKRINRKRTSSSPYYLISHPWALTTRSAFSLLLSSLNSPGFQLWPVSPCFPKSPSLLIYLKISCENSFLIL